MEMIERRRRMMGQGGFTLIELLVVIAILGILAGVVIFAVGNTTDSADKNACKIEKSTFQTANAAAKADKAGGGSALPSSYLDSSTATVGGGNVSGKYWQMPDTAGGGTGPVAKTGVTLPTGCS